MLMVKILGPRYANCQRLEAIVRQVAAERGVAAAIENVTGYDDIMRWPILATPGLVVNDRLVASGRIPTKDEIARWLAGNEYQTR